MNVYKHQDNGWHWISHKELRIDRITWRALLNHLRAKFDREFLRWKSQGIFTYNTDEETLKKTVNDFINSRSMKCK